MILPKARSSNIVVQELKDEVLIYDLKISKAYCLNETSALVWELCDGKRTITEISDEMSKRMKTLISEDFLYIALDQLNKDGLLEDGLGSHFEGFSRREVIRKVGFASVVALPLVRSVVAPEAAMAQSSCGIVLEACSPGTCCTGLFCVANIRCCVPGAFGGVAPGVVLGCRNTEAICLTVSNFDCCGSFQTTFVETGCNGPGSGICTCSV